MRAYNYVVEMTPDFEQNQYRVRELSILTSNPTRGEDPFICLNFFKNNLPVVNLCTGLINRETSRQYQREERTLIRRRFNFSPSRIKKLRSSMCEDRISSDEKVKRLSTELGRLHKDQRFTECMSMGEITFLNIALSLDLKDEAPVRLLRS